MMIAPVVKGVLNHAAFRVTALLVVAIFILKLWQPVLFQYFISYTLLIIEMAYKDSDRHQYAKIITWQTEWKLHQMEMEYNQDWCRKNQPLQEKVAWLTAMMNDNYAVGAVFVAYMLKKLSCHHKMIALISETVSPKSREALMKAGYDVRLVEPLDCNWMDRRAGRPIRNLGIPGTHMRFHAWNYTEYSKIIYFDPDLFPLSNIDELFDMNSELAAGYCGQPGVVDPCFNAGILMFKPSEKAYNEILQSWMDLSRGSACPNDQVLLWHYYADNGRWTPLPYAYNVRRELYHPMKVYHFACCLTPKPWRVKKPPSRKEAAIFSGPFVDHWDMVTVWWTYFYKALDEFQLQDWYDWVKYRI